MKRGPQSGQSANPALWGSVPQLITTYYSDTPDSVAPAQRVAFGTTGYRSSAFAHTFNEWHIPAATQAVVDKALAQTTFDNDTGAARTGGETKHSSLAETVEAAQHLFDPGVLTIGFARRFAAYERPNLLLHDSERLLRLLTNPQRPVQLILAGKAHPNDPTGQAMIQQWMQFIAHPEARKRVIFLSDYDMLLTERLVQGVDVWLNNPRRPWEASGTSGMKVLVNGGLNLSELDGWWAEAYSSQLGWSLGDGKEHDDDPAWDAAEASELYERLEQEVVPEFYSRDDKGIPTAWVARMRESMARLTSHFSANRVVRQYTQDYYLPATAEYRRRAANKGATAEKIAHWRRHLQDKWVGQRFGQVRVATGADHLTLEAEVYLGGIEADAVRVEIYADGTDNDGPYREEMKRAEPLPGDAGGYLYSARVPEGRPATDYTVRVMPRWDGVAIPLEADWIVWHR